MGNQEIRPSVIDDIGYCSCECPFIHKEGQGFYWCGHYNGCKCDCRGGAGICEPWVRDLVHKNYWLRLGGCRAEEFMGLR